MSKVHFTLNGKPTEASYEPGMNFLEVLREECGMVSAKNGCAPEGTCGCCTIMIDGKAGYGLPAQAGADGGPRSSHPRRNPRRYAAGSERGLRGGGGRSVRILHSGDRGAGSSLMQHGTADNREAVAKALDAHVCRCTGYARIVDVCRLQARPGKTASTWPPASRDGTTFSAKNLALSRNPSDSCAWPAVERPQRKWHRQIALALSRA